MSNFFLLLVKLFLCASEVVYSVSIRRRKNLFGKEWEPSRIINQANNPVIPVEQPSEVALPESSAIVIKTKDPEQGKRKKGRPKMLIAKPKQKSTESVKKWFARKKEESKRGDKKAIEFFAKRNSYKTRKAREKTARIQQGTATPLEQEQYKRLRLKQKQWRDNNREKRNAYLRNWNARQKLKSDDE